MGGGGGMGGVPARGWNFWESAPVNTLKTQACRVRLPPLVTCRRCVHAVEGRRSHNSQPNKREKGKEGV